MNLFAILINVVLDLLRRVPAAYRFVLVLGFGIVVLALLIGVWFFELKIPEDLELLLLAVGGYLGFQSAANVNVKGLPETDPEMHAHREDYPEDEIEPIPVSPEEDDFWAERDH